jgi:glycosyltransferase involved in cell wall biosynthesis
MEVIMFDAAYPPPIVGGKEKQAHLLANELKKQGIDVCALSYEHNSNQTQFHDNIKVYRVKKGIMAPLLFSLRLMYLRVNSKILHIHTPSRIGHLIVFIGFILGYRIVFKFPIEKMLNNLTLIEILVWKSTIRMAKLLVVLEKQTQDILISYWRVPATKIFLACNGVKVRKKYKNKIPSKIIRLLFVGRLVKQKRCCDLILACNKLNEKNIEFQLDIIGDGSLFESLYAMTKNMGIENKINFQGYQSNVTKYMKDADILVLPSEKEGMSNVLLEAMAIGLPIICTEVGAAKNMLGIQGEKFLIKPNDYNGLADNIEMLAKNQSLLVEYGSYLYKRSKINYSIQTIAGTYSEHYQRMG